MTRRPFFKCWYLRKRLRSPPEIWNSGMAGGSQPGQIWCIDFGCGNPLGSGILTRTMWRTTSPKPASNFSRTPSQVRCSIVTMNTVALFNFLLFPVHVPVFSPKVCSKHRAQPHNLVRRYPGEGRTTKSHPRQRWPYRMSPILFSSLCIPIWRMKIDPSSNSKSRFVTMTTHSSLGGGATTCCALSWHCEHSGTFQHVGGASHAKWQSMSRSATLARQIAAASMVTNRNQARHQSQPNERYACHTHISPSLTIDHNCQAKR